MPLSLSSSSVVDGVRERAFRVGDVPGALWDAESGEAPVPLILLAHGGGQHKAAPGIAARARRFVAELGATAVAIDAPGHGDRPRDPELAARDRKSTRLNSSHANISYAVFCLKKKKT